jgi:NAD+ synthase (glutamine-hydrolysing)
MRIAAAQLNQTVGDFPGNADRIIGAARQAADLGVRVLVTPELSLTGYPPEDLLLRDAFQRRSNEALDRIREATAPLDLFLLVGHPVVEGQGAARRRFNAASLLHRGRVVGVCRKRELPNYAVFDEARYFARGEEAFVFDVDGMRLGVAVCEDFWFPVPPRALHEIGAQALLVLNASPYHLGKQHTRLDTARAIVSALGMPMLAANQVGGQDELVFDGLSFALDASGALAAQGKAFESDLLVVELQAGADGRVDFVRQAIPESPPPEAQVYAALVLGVRDYIGKNGFPGAIVGLSGGVDSALVLAIAVDALGARDMAERLGVRYDELPIGACFDAFRATLAGEFRGLPEDTTEENLQARIRGMLLMALSNKFGSIVLTTGNKSEMAVGYATLYGDMAGGFAVIKDIAKTLVWRLCRWRNTVSDVIPDRIITRPPSAELKPGQTDQDSLPPYETLDAIVRLYMEEDRSVDEIVAAGHPADAVARVVRLIQVNEYKRRQAPVGIRVTHRAFGRDWRYPITSKFRD